MSEALARKALLTFLATEIELLDTVAILLEEPAEVARVRDLLESRALRLRAERERVLREEVRHAS